MADSITQLFENHLDEVLNKYFEPDDFFVLGVSGGPDSMALMYLLKKLGVAALVVHVNYGKRAESSDMDQELTEQLAFEWGFECCTIPLDTESSTDENFQNWARKQRYQFFRDLKEEYAAAAILTAHHQDDQVETILQKVLRGSGPEAWQGIAEWDGELFRPLLPFSKQQILDYCEAEAIPYRTDESNLKNDYARNFLRNTMAGQMDHFFPGWRQNVLELADQGRRFEDAMEFIAGKVSEGHIINLQPYSALPDRIKTSVLKYVLQQNGLQSSLSKGEWQQLAEIEHMQTGGFLKAGELLLQRNREEIVIQPVDKQSGTEEHWTISRAAANRGFNTGPISLKLVTSSGNQSDLQIDANKLKWPLTLRRWEDGDRMIPFGMTQSQKIAKHLTSRKIPAHLKQKALVLCGSDGTIYAIIYPEKADNGEWGAVSETVRYHPKTETFLTINISN